MFGRRDWTQQLQKLGEADSQKHHHLEMVLRVIVLTGPLATIPQIAEIWFIDKSGAGVSFVTWGYYILLSLVWITYGIIRKDKLILYTNILWAIGEIIILIGAAVFDNDWL
ncbi:MAG: SemiSWEET family transporter [Candidatus Kapaibacterium sp.]